MPTLTSITVHVSPLIELSMAFLYAGSLPSRFPSFGRFSVSLPEQALMLLEASAALAPVASFKATAAQPRGNLLLRRPAFSVTLFGSPIGTRRPSSSLAAAESGQALTGLLFHPLEEINEELSLLPTSPDLSLARQKYADECESALNQQINVEYNNSYVYHALFAYFDRDNVALKGLAKFFKESSEEEREHAEKLMEYQNRRGGRVKLQSIVMPLSEFDHPEKGDALHAMELTLALEKLTNEKLLQLHKVAEKCNDAKLADFIESEFLEEQVEAIKRISEFVAQLRRVGKGHGVWHFDQMLLHEGDAAAA